ncbi:hypothetical protein HMPREF0293_2731, partial [Corynebacterium glucuronolyticum ATCC 51866]
MVIPFTMPYVHVTEVERGKFVFSMTNGATISGAEIVKAKLAEERLVALVSPLGPKDFGVYRVEMTPDSRGADPLERFIQSTRNPVCAWPGCGRPASKSQIHH